jgi:hypothetical protein
MKLVLLLMMSIYLSSFSNLCLSSEVKTEFNLQNHLTMMMKFKTKTRNMLENLYLSANRVEMSKFNSKEKTSRKKRFTKTNLSSHFSSVREMASLNKLNTKDYVQFRYKSYQEIVFALGELSKKYPDYLQVTTAQKLYKLPHPGGFCDSNKKM